jgi:hypothetical protein
MMGNVSGLSALISAQAKSITTDIITLKRLCCRTSEPSSIGPDIRPRGGNRLDSNGPFSIIFLNQRSGLSSLGFAGGTSIAARY